MIAAEFIVNLTENGAARSTIGKNRWLLEEVAAPLAQRPIVDISPAELLDLLKPVERSGRRETAKRLRATISAVEAVSGMTRTYTFVFDPDPEGGFVVACPALPGLITHGATIEEARMMARDAMEGYIEVLIEDGEELPESDAPQAAPCFDHLAHTLRTEKVAAPIFAHLSTQIATAI